MSALPGHRAIDLSLALAEDLPCSWPTHMPYQHKVFNWFAPADGHVSRGPYQTRWLLMDEHTGTHFDAPTHGVPPPDSGLPGAGPAGAIDNESVDVEQLMGPAVVIDVTDHVDRAPAGESPLILPAVVERFESRHGRLRAGEVVLLRADWDRRYRPGLAGDAYVRDCAVARRAPGWPAPAGETIVALAERGVRCVGTDGVSMGAVHDGGPAHTQGLSRGMVFVEGLSRLAELPVRGAWFVFLPVKVRGGTGGPGRAIAFVPDGGVG